MTIRAIVLRLLKYIGVWSLSPDANTNETNERGLDTGDTEFALSCVNAAMQEIFANGPVALSEKRRTFVLYPPTQITFHATQYSTAITSVTGFQQWMTGCTIQSGDPTDNELVNATTLQRPYMSGTGTVTATVYCDAILLPVNTKAVMEAPVIPNVSPLSVATSRETFRHWSHSNSNNANTMELYGVAYTTTNKTTGEPRIYFVEAAFLETSAALPLFLRLNPMPIKSTTIDVRVRLKPPVFTTDDVGAPEDTAPLTVIPVDWIESILVPMAVKRFQAHPSFEATEAAQREITSQYQDAARELDSFRPAVEVPEALYI